VHKNVKIKIKAAIELNKPTILMSFYLITKLGDKSGVGNPYP